MDWNLGETMWDGVGTRDYYRENGISNERRSNHEELAGTPSAIKIPLSAR